MSWLSNIKEIWFEICEVIYNREVLQYHKDSFYLR